MEPRHLLVLSVALLVACGHGTQEIGDKSHALLLVACRLLGALSLKTMLSAPN